MSITVRIENKKRGPYKTPAEKSNTVRKADNKKRGKAFTDIALDSYEELARLGRGITEDSLVEPEIDCLDGEDCDPIEEENPFHSKNGQWSSKANATCKSTYFSTGDRERVNGPLTDFRATGRGRKPNSQGKYRCKDNSRKYESLWRDYVENTTLKEDPVTIPDDKYQIAKKFQAYEKLIWDLKKQMGAAQKKGLKNCPLSWEVVARIMNTISLSRDGDLYKKEK